MSPTFDLKGHQPSESVLYTIPSVPKLGKLRVRYAGQTNRAYTNAVAKATAKTGAARRIARGQIDADLLAENLKLDRALFPRHVIIGWEDVKDSSTGEPVPFDQIACEAFLKALPDWLMQDLSQFCANPANFTPDSIEAPDDLDFEDQAGE